MSVGKAVCLICGEALFKQEEAEEATCAFCGKKGRGVLACSQGHYVCGDCHRAQSAELILRECAVSESSDPIGIVQKIMAQKHVYPNGPEHHTLVGAALLAAYRNAGGDIDLETALEELRKRSLEVPGGACGYWGMCGAAASAGQYCSIITETTPLDGENWTGVTRLTSRILERLADIGGPRCCKRTGFTAIDEAVSYTASTMGVKMSMPAKIECTFSDRNDECKKTDCPYYTGEAD